MQVNGAMRKTRLAAAVVFLVALLAFWGAWTARRRAAAASANARQVQELMAAAKRLDLPPDVEPEKVEICHLPVTDRTWETYVFVTVRSDASYEELKAQLETPPRYPSEGATPLKVLDWETYRRADWISQNATAETAESTDRWVLSWYVLTADSTDPQLREGVAASCVLS